MASSLSESSSDPPSMSASMIIASMSKNDPAPPYYLAASMLSFAVTASAKHPKARRNARRQPQNLKAVGIPKPADWEKHRRPIKQLYIGKGLSLEDVMSEMSQHYAFNAM